MGQGEHEDFCMLEVKYKCVCGHSILGRYAEVKSMLDEHLISECLEFLCRTTRKLMRVVNKFSEWGLPDEVIELYKT